MYLLPGVGRVHEGGVLYLFVDVLVLVEGEGPGEGDVDDDPRAPHVEGPVVSLIAEDLRSKVGWGTHYRLPEPLFSNYPRESEVTQFNLEIFLLNITSKIIQNPNIANTERCFRTGQN